MTPSHADTTRWDRHTVVVVIEVAMLDTRVIGELLTEARKSGAKLILAGDDRQPASIERGDLAGPDVRFATKHGPADFAGGNRVQFTDISKPLHIYNGNAGTITGIDAPTGELTARLDGGRAVSWSAEDFDGFRHGYAGTIYKGQGKTLDHTYLYHTQHWRAAPSHAALTRQRDSPQVFVAWETARDASPPTRRSSAPLRGKTGLFSGARAKADRLAEGRAARPSPRT